MERSTFRRSASGLKKHPPYNDIDVDDVDEPLISVDYPPVPWFPLGVTHEGVVKGGWGLLPRDVLEPQVGMRVPMNVRTNTRRVSTIQWGPREGESTERYEETGAMATVVARQDDRLLLRVERRTFHDSLPNPRDRRVSVIWLPLAIPPLLLLGWLWQKRRSGKLVL